MNVKSHKTGNDRAPYYTLNDPSKANNRGRALMLSNNPIAKSVTQLLHRDKYYANDFLPSDGSVRNICDTISDKVRIYKEIQEQLPDIKAAKRIRTSMILSPNDLMTIALSYTCEGSFLPPELVRRLLEDVRSVFDTSEYDFKKYLKQITDDITVDTGSYALAVIPEPTINDIINAPNLVAIESRINDEISRLNSKSNYNLVFGGCTEGFTHIKCADNEKLFERKKGAIKRSDILNYKIVEGIESLQVRALKDLRNHARMAKKYGADHSGVEGYNDYICTESIGNEDNNQAEIERFKKEIFHNKPSAVYNAIKLNQTDWSKRPAVGHPMTFHYPSECVVPIHVPGDPTQHIGFLVLTGTDNNPLTTPWQSPAFNDFTSGIGYTPGGNQGSTYGEVISSISRYQNGTNCDYSKNFNPAELLTIAKRIIEDDVTERLYNGTYNSSSQAVSCPENVALIMLSYRLADMQVNLQFIPASLMTYFALDYDELGVGRSSLEDVKLIASLRSAIQLADTMAGIKNSIGNTKLRLNVDSYDPNIKQTVESIIQRVASVRAMTPILNNNPPSSISQFMTSAFMQVDVTVDGGGGGGGSDPMPIPQTKVEVTEEAPNYPGPSDELKEDLRNKSLLGVGVPKELVDAASSVDFAASIIYSNLMLNKQTLEDQAILNTHITNHIRQFTMNSGRLMGKFVSTIKAEKESIAKYLSDKNKLTVKQIIDEFVNNLEVRLPEPNNTKHEAQLDALNSYIALVDLAVEKCINDGIIGKILEGVNGADENSETGTSNDQMFNIIKMNLIRNFMQSNGILPELFTLFDDDDDSTNITDIIGSLDSESDIIIQAYGQLKELVTKKIEEVKAQNNALESEAVNSSDSSSGFGGDDDSNSEDGDGFNMDGDDGFNFDEPDDNPSDEKDSNDEDNPEESDESDEAKETKEPTEEESNDEPTPVE